MATNTVAPTMVCKANQYADAMVRMMEGSHFAPRMPKTMRQADLPRDAVIHPDRGHHDVR